MATQLEMTLRYSGGRAESYDSTWGQYSIWQEMQSVAPQHERFNLALINCIAPESTIDTVLTSVRRALSTHESLRTRLRRSADGGLVQILHGDVDLQISVVELEETDSEPDEVDRLYQRLQGTPFDVENEWPLRVGAVVRDQIVRYLLVVVSHHSVDAWALPVLEATIRGHAPPETVTGCLQPLDEARFQRSPEGQQITAAAEAHWRRTLLLAPAQMLPPSVTGAHRPGHRKVILTSSALATAIWHLSEELSIGPSALLLAAYSSALAKAAVSTRCVLRVQVHNRFRRQVREAVTSTTMEGLFMVGVEDASFREIAHRTWSAALSTYRHAYYDKLRVDAVKAETERERRVEIGLSCWLNDRWSTLEKPSDLDKFDAPGACLADTRLEWVEEREKHSNLSVGLRAYGSAREIVLEAVLDTAVLAVPQAETLLKDIERAAVDAVTEAPR